MVIDNNSLELILRSHISAMEECPVDSDAVYCVRPAQDGTESVAVRVLAGAPKYQDVGGGGTDVFPVSLFYQIPTTNSSVTLASARETLDKLARAMAGQTITGAGNYKFGKIQIVNFSDLNTDNSAVAVYMQQMRIDITYAQVAQES